VHFPAAAPGCTPGHVGKRSRLERRDKLLLASLLAVWLVMIGLEVRAVARGTAYSPLTVAAAAEPGGYPVIVEFFPWLEAEKSGLQIGDRLIALGGADLKGLGPLGFYVLVPAEAGNARSIGVVFERNGERHRAVIPLGSLRELWPAIPASIAFVATAVLLLVKASPVEKTRPGFLALMLLGIYLGTQFAVERPGVTYAVLAVRIVVLTLVFPVTLLAMHAFGGGRPPPSRVGRFLPWLLALCGPLFLATVLGLPHARMGLFAFGAITLASVLLVVSRGYGHADPILRRRVRWVVYGIYCAAIPILAIAVVSIFDERVLPWASYARLGSIAVPVCILIAIARYDLFDVDRLISTTASYNIVLIAIVGAGLAIIPPASAQAASRFGVDASVGQLLFGALAAAVVVPLQRRVRPRLERHFFPERYAIDRGIEQLLLDLGQQREARALLACCGEGLSRLLRLTSCAAHLRLDRAYVCVFTRGTAGSSELGVDSPLIAALRSQHGTLSLGRLVDRDGEPELDPFVRAALESLDAEVILPVRCDDELAAFLQLGEKGSGDIYTPTDLRLLAEVADRVSTRLEQLDLDRRTVPGRLLLPSKFELVEKVGQGGMGIVFKARHLVLDTVVAVKVLPERLAADPEFVQRFEREARLMAQLRHPNIVRVFDVDTEGSLHYLVMEYVDGRTVSDALRHDGPFSLERTLDVAMEVAEALEFAHTHEPSVVHRDVSPSNILIESGTGRVVVTDFGIAKIVAAEPRLTSTGEFLGKTRYASPEHLRGERSLDGRADIYSLGMVMYEMLAGQSFFASCGDLEAVERVLFDPADLVPEFRVAVPDRFVEILSRAIAKDRERRYQTAGDLLRDLRAERDRIAADEPTDARTPP